MKKRILCVLLVCVLLITGGCVASKGVKKATKLIDAIGEVSLDSEEAILEAEEAVAGLKERELEKVENLKVLRKARASYDRIKKAYDLIKGIGEVTLDSEQAILDAEEAFEELSEKEVEEVRNQKKLTEARETFTRLVEEDKEKKKKEAARAIFDLLDKASQAAEEYGSDIYTAWNTGIHDADEKGFDLTSLAKPLNLSTDEIKQGFVYMFNKDKWNTLSDSDKRKKLDTANSEFKLYLIIVDSQFSLCVNIVNSAYQVIGKEDMIKTDLEEAKTRIKTLSDQNPDYDVCSKLRTFYTKIQTYFDFCTNPTGSFNSLQDTLKTFRQDVLAAKNELSYDLD